MPIAVLIGLVVFFAILPMAYGEKIVYSNSYPSWFSYDCTDTAPSSWTSADPSANIWKYFAFYDGDCYATTHTFDLTDLANIENVTSVTYYVDSRSLILTDPDITETTQIDCTLYYFGNVDTSADISKTPDTINSFDCTGTAGAIQEVTIPFSSAQNATLTGHIQAGNFSQTFMIFPDFSNATFRSNLDTNGYEYAIGKFDNALEINGDGFNCVTIEASNWCNFYNEPWEAIKKALGEDYIGDWFYVLVFFPLPFVVFLATRNGAYAGFVCLPILIFINSIDQVVFEVSLSLVALASAFGFYELFRKKLVE